MRALRESDIANAVMGGMSKTSDGGEFDGDHDARTEAHNQALYERGGRTRAEIEEEKNEDWTGRNKNSMDLGRALGGRGMAVVEARRIRKTTN
jgi:hypothetical protein